MSGTLRHAFVSAKSDGTDTSKVQASNWNADHVIGGGSNFDILQRDTTADAGFKLLAKKYVDVRDYGAVGDGVADDAPAINAAAAAAFLTGGMGGGVVYFPPDLNYRLASGVSVLHDDQVWSMYGATFRVDFVGAAITIGSNTTRVRRAVLLGGMVDTYSGNIDWTAGGVGIRLLKANNCVLRDVSVRRFEKGIEITSPDQPNASETTQNWIDPQIIADCALPIYIYANNGGAVNENIFRGGEVSYSGSCPNASTRFAVTIDRHASSNGTVNGIKFYGTYFGCSMVSNRPALMSLNAVGCKFDATHAEGFPSTKVTWGADALAGGVPNMFWGGSADWVDPEADMSAGGVGTAAAFIYSGRDGCAIAGGNQAGSDYVLRLKQLGANTKVTLSIADSTNTENASITGEGVIKGKWVKNGGSKALTSAQIDVTTSTAFINALQVDLISGRIYEFDGLLYISANVTGGSKVRMNASGGLTASLIRYSLKLFDYTTSAYITSRLCASFDLVQANAGVTSGLWEVTGTIVPTANGSLNLQFTQSATTGTSSVLTGSIFRVRDVTP